LIKVDLSVFKQIRLNKAALQFCPKTLKATSLTEKDTVMSFFIIKTTTT